MNPNGQNLGESATITTAALSLYPCTRPFSSLPPCLAADCFCAFCPPADTERQDRPFPMHRTRTVLV